MGKIVYKIVRSGVIDKYDVEESVIDVTWVITSSCPYKCSYCYERDTHGRKSDPKLSDFARAIPRLSEILSHLPHGKQFQIRLFGGEPTYHDKFLPLVHLLRSELPDAMLSCFTNLFKPVSFLENILQIVPDFKFDISVHFEYLKEEQLLKKLDFLSEAGVFVNLYIQFLPKENARVIKLAEIIRERFPEFSLFIQFLRSRESGFKKLMEEYSPRDHELVRQYCSNSEPRYFIDYLNEKGQLFRKEFTFNEAFSAELSNFKSLYCAWPMRRLTISANGIARTGFCLPKNSISLYGETWPEEIPRFFSQPAICSRDFCICRGMRDAPKWSDIEFAPAYMQGKQNIR